MTKSWLKDYKKSKGYQSGIKRLSKRYQKVIKAVSKGYQKAVNWVWKYVLNLRLESAIRRCGHSQNHTH
jgi:hypothetical protein